MYDLFRVKSGPDDILDTSELTPDEKLVNNDVKWADFKSHFTKITTYLKLQNVISIMFC